jgi:NAD(P)-dependent dehydrogenase (short-subunit alcohol dehydrogenase family)
VTIGVTRDFAGKVAVIVGAGPGIGRACAVAFASAGADVIVAARRGAPLQALAAEVAAGTGRRVEPAVTDLRDLASCSRLVESAVERLGGLDALVCVAASGAGRSTVDDADFADWRAAFEVNVLGTLEVSRHAARSMAARGGGAIVHVHAACRQCLGIGTDETFDILDGVVFTTAEHVTTHRNPRSRSAHDGLLLGAP